MKLTLSIKYKKNTGLLFSPAEINTLYLYGISINATNGTKFSDEAYEYYVREAQKTVENWFSVKIVKQLVTESSSYYWDSYGQQFPIINTKYIVQKPLALVGLLKTVEQVRYPVEWLSYAKDPDQIGGRRISIVPTGSGSMANEDVILTGIVTQLGIQRLRNIPDYWNYQYISGFDLDNLPWDLIGVIGKLATFGPLNIAGDMILGSAGIASQSLSIDGLSQSISTTASATSAGYSARLLNYGKEIQETVKRIEGIYRGLQFEVL